MDGLEISINVGSYVMKDKFSLYKLIRDVVYAMQP
jgi:hypothetical protein